MDDLTIDQALELARMHGGHRVSLFMPTRPFVPGSPDENAIRLKTLLNRAAEQLGERGVRLPEIEALLSPGRVLTDDRPFWMRAEHGLAVLLGPEGMHALRLPIAMTESVRVNERYYVRPLLPFVESGGHFWLLFISQNKVRLFEGTRQNVREMPAEQMPVSLAEALRWDDFERTSLQFHSSAGQGRAQAPTYHGNKEPDYKNELARFFRQIDAALQERLRGQTAPLVLAGVEYLIPLYRDVNTYPHLVHEAVMGNVETLPLPELHRKAVGVLQGLAERESHRFIRQIEETWGSAKTTPDPETIVPAAFVGRVDTLFLTDAGEWWGRYDESAGRATFHKLPAEGDEDLLDRAALQTLENGGAVVSLPPDRMPRGEDAVAVLRY